MSPPPTTCSACGQPAAIFVVTVRRRGDFLACPRCHVEYLRQCEQNAKDEERERLDAQARSQRSAERDAQRVERQRAKGAQL